jgi:hypothetical protein
MDDRKHPTSPASRYAGLDSESDSIADGVRLPGGHQVDTYCFRGDELSQGLAAALRIMGIEPHGLQGCIGAANERGSPSRRDTDDIDPR